jgi:hypothetical protein
MTGQNEGMSFQGNHRPESTPALTPAVPARCRAKWAALPGVAFCLDSKAADCDNRRYFNEVAYCIHPDREEIIGRTTD